MSSREGLVENKTEKDDAYVSRTGQDTIPVQSDDSKVEEPLMGDQKTDAQLERDDKEAIDTSNIMDERTRGAAKPGQFREPGDEEGLEE